MPTHRPFQTAGRCSRPRRPALDRQLDLLDAAVARQYHDDQDRRAALTPDTEGIGSGPDVVMADGQQDSRLGP
jgi:hypothetical protein